MHFALKSSSAFEEGTYLGFGNGLAIHAAPESKNRR